jgi:hypothetical protein
MTYLTFQASKQSLLDQKLLSETEFKELAERILEYSSREDTIISIARTVQAFGATSPR